MPTKTQWTERWYVPKSDGSGFWTVARKIDGTMACSCPVWTFAKEKDCYGNRIRTECHHIRQIKGRTEDIDAAEVMARLVGIEDPKKTYPVFRDAYYKAGYMSTGFTADPPEEWQKEHLDKLKHDSRLSLVCLKDGDGGMELLTKDL